jgi:hypothetical protein
MDNGIPVILGEKRQTDNKRLKKPYVKPSFRFERVFETQALACGKQNVTQKHCAFNRKTS